MNYRAARLLFLSAFLFLAACGYTANSVEAMTAEDADLRLEPLYGYALKSGSMQITVMSTGCTRAEDFLVDVRESSGRCEVRIVRKQPDRCRKAPMLEHLSLQWQAPENCSERELMVVNPFRDASSAVAK